MGDFLVSCLCSYRNSVIKMHSDKKINMERVLRRERKKGLKGLLSGTCALLALCVASGAQAEPQIIYRETFGFCTASLGKEAGNQTNWAGLVTGFSKEKVSNLKSFSYGLSDIGGSVNSLPIGLAQGYAFWFRPVYGLTVLTGEFQFDAGILKSSSTSIEYKQRLSGVNPLTLQPNKTHLAFLIDNTWYISGPYVQQKAPGFWESASVTPSALTYGTVAAVAGVGPQTPALFDAPLPASGTVRAFGLFIDEVNGRVRVDNFVIKANVPSGSSISTEVQKPDLSLCPPSSPDVGGSGGSGGGGDDGEDPADDDGDNGPDKFTPQPIPTPNVHAKVFQFCPVKQQGTGRLMVVSAKARGAMLRKVSQSSLADLRDRAMVNVLSRRPMALGALVNSKVSDYDQTTGVLSLQTRRAAKPMKLKLRGAAQDAMRVYLAHASAPKEPLAPLFIVSDPKAAHVTVQKALCMADIRTILKARAKQANVAIDGIYRPSLRRR
jgi:hypothetical protein